MKCYNCGKEYNDKDSKCWKCGAENLSKIEIQGHKIMYTISRIFLAASFINIFIVINTLNIAPPMPNMFHKQFLMPFLFMVSMLGLVFAVTNYKMKFKQQEGKELIILYIINFVLYFIYFVS